ncbi:unnamed protein product [Sphenostylis stenocarpa]|uniref:Uncharacterized protein n=1 Tax=Sphenostylis stenocarpa TaxID=92480 RepID=A0AA86SP38_9FABA|nr:unnamed protein product [Sphenostylis stenocarpa]
MEVGLKGILVNSHVTPNEKRESGKKRGTTCEPERQKSLPFCKGTCEVHVAEVTIYPV